MSYRVIDGDLIDLTNKFQFDVIGHGCNCQCTMGAGIAVPMKLNFGCHTFKMEESRFKGDIRKLGTIDYKYLWKELDQFGGRWVAYPDEVSFVHNSRLCVVNMYTQFNYGRNHADGDQRPLDMEALTLCLRKINKLFAGKRIGLPKIGSGLAGGDFSKIELVIKQELTDMDVTVVNFKK